MGISKAGKTIGKIGHKFATRTSKAFEKAMRRAMRKKPTFTQKAKNFLRSPGKIGVAALATYGAARGMEDLGLIKRKRSSKKASKDASKFKNNREKWASEESYVPQTQRRAMGGPVFNDRGMRVPGMRHDL